MHRVTLYTKPGCHLCEVVRDLIDEVAETRPLELEERNVLDDLRDYERYRYEIPVVLVDGVEIARHRLTRDRLERALAPG